ncbi:MAG TPA: hypothetical protein H9804_10450 [Candidatus Mucispirillum faecigallinarum]|uniref:YopX protein domain-containing protein n=1 Tax=Candidatus Mucispirillum faecigallinarum TaxID=2838699 RepID=A0A9D2GX45_9BACT|nr:hypothetical protein [Candidatus Mucispirillum faecigallinarum]
MQQEMEFRAVSPKGTVYTGGFFSDGEKVGVIRNDMRGLKISYAPGSAYMGFYTGLKDKKGFKIFTNDLVEISSSNEFNGLKGIVLFYKGDCLVGTEKGYFYLNNAESEYVTKGNAMQHVKELSDKLKDMLIVVKGVE